MCQVGVAVQPHLLGVVTKPGTKEMEMRKWKWETEMRKWFRLPHFHFLISVSPFPFPHFRFSISISFVPGFVTTHLLGETYSFTFIFITPKKNFVLGLYHVIQVARLISPAQLDFKVYSLLFALSFTCTVSCL